MLSEAKFVIAGHPITSVELLIAAAVLLFAAALLLAMTKKKRRVVIHPSPVTDEIIIQLGRIADAVERIAYQPLQNNVSALPGTGTPPKAVASPDPEPMPYSMFAPKR